MRQELGAAKYRVVVVIDEGRLRPRRREVSMTLAIQLHF
jgi:hypothetical protein